MVDSNDGGGVEDVCGVDANGGDDSNFGDANSKVDCGEDLVDGDGYSNDGDDVDVNIAKDTNRSDGRLTDCNGTRTHNHLVRKQTLKAGDDGCGNTDSGPNDDSGSDTNDDNRVSDDSDGGIDDVYYKI